MLRSANSPHFSELFPLFAAADSGTGTNSFCYLWGSAGQPTLRLAFGKFLTVKAEISKWQLLHRGERGAVMEKEMSVKKNLPTNRNFVLQKCLGPQWTWSCTEEKGQYEARMKVESQRKKLWHLAPKLKVKRDCWGKRRSTSILYNITGSCQYFERKKLLIRGGAAASG